MMKILKFLRNLGLALVAVAITFVVLFLVTPSWQRASLKLALQQDTERRWEVGSVHLQPTRAEIGGLYVLEGPAGMEVQYAELEGPFWKALLTGELVVERGSVQGIFVDLTNLHVGELTSRDWQSMKQQISEDRKFWEERLELVFRKLEAAGWRFQIGDLTLQGEVLLPGEETVPFRWLLVEATSGPERSVQLERAPAGGGVEL